MSGWGSHTRVTGAGGERAGLIQEAQDTLNARFTNMTKAFIQIDLDGSGTVSKAEIRRAFEMWGYPMDDEKMEIIFEACDRDGSGEIDYKCARARRSYYTVSVLL